MNSPSTSSHPRSKSSRENAENDCSEKKQNVKHEKVPLKEVNRDDSVSTTRPATKKADRKKLVEDYNDNVPFEGNNYPEETTSPIDRRFLQLSEVPGKKHGNGEQSTGEFLPEADSMCVICHQEECPKGKTELIDCHGQMSGEMSGVERITTLNKNYEEEYKKEYEELLKKDPNAPYKPKKLLIPERPCRSKFHESCIMKYNAAGYFFQYAARLECQAKFLCPLHCCNRCNVGHQRQTAYAGELIECAKCLRAFHIQTCYPAGARDQYVEFQMGDKKKNFEFLICPAHADEDSTESASSEKKKVAAKKDSGKRPNLKACCSEGCTLGVEFKLINCRSCVRSFHVECREVIKIDGVLVSNDLCEKCLCKDDVPLNVPVLALWESKDFYLAKTVGWYNFPSNRRSSEPNFEKLGYTVVQWLSEDSAGKTFSIVPVHNVAPLIDEYVRLAKPNLRSFWKKTFDDYNDKGCLFGPYVSKLVYQPWKTSRLGRNITAQPPTKEDFGDCRCENNARKCLDESCDSVNEGVECPPDCGDLCNNRNVSKGYVNPKLLLRDTKTKGYGIFAKEEIAQGEFLAEYVGELINPTEKAYRLQIIAISRDFQANQYMMDLGKGWAVDAARYGNLARYINHSCDPNSASYSTAIVKGGNAENRKYERRVCVRATRPIAKGEEITFCYQMESTVEIPCLCGATNCTGYMGRGEEDEDEEDEKTKRMGRAKKNTKNSKPSKKRLRAPSVREATTSKKRQFSEPSSRAVPRPSSSQQASTSAPRPVRSSNAQRSVESRESCRDEPVATISSRRMSTRERVSKCE